MGDMMRAMWEDEQRRARMTPLERAAEAVETQECEVRLVKSRLKNEVRKLHAKRAELARLRREGAK